MKKTLTGFAIVLVAALWMSGSWAFFNSIANGAETTPTTSPTTVENQAKPATAPHYEHHWKHHRWRHHHWRHNHFYPYWWNKLNLTAAQKKKIKAIREQGRMAMRPFVEELRTGHHELMSLRKTGRFDEAKVRSIAERQAKTIANVIIEREHTLYRIRAVLTPGQRAKLDKMRKSWKAEHFRHWKNGGPKD